MAFIEDLKWFFNPHDFAEAALLNGKIINGIVGRRSVVINNVGTNALTFSCGEMMAQHGDILLIKDNHYKIIGIHFDGTGIAVFILEQQQCS